MPCFHPLRAIRGGGGIKIVSSDSAIYNLTLPCGRCRGCRLERSRQWAVRCMHEASLYEHNSFITLTYDDAHLPADLSLNHKHFQLFMKRLRKRFGSNIRYYMCGEYGSQLLRPHYHAILFNHSFNDLTLWKKSGSGEPLFRSKILESLWTYGFSSIGSVTFESAAYVARYIMDKQTGDDANIHYSVVDPETGEMTSRIPEYNRMSLRTGIGANWFNKFKSDVYPHDRVIVDGVKTKPPRYYDKLLARESQEQFNKIRDKRLLDMQDNMSDNTRDRLLVKEAVTNAKLLLLKRGLL